MLAGVCGAGWAQSTRLSQPLRCMDCLMLSESAEPSQRTRLAVSQLQSAPARAAARFPKSIQLPAVGIFLHEK